MISSFIVLLISLVSPTLAGWRIIGGEKAQKTQFPYFVSLHDDGKHICGGAIIDERTIVSAAHCFKNNYFPHTWTVVVGSPFMVKTQLLPEHLKYRVSAILDHRGYSKLAIGRNDVAVLVTKEPIVFNDEVSPIRLADKDDRPAPGTRCYTMGYGWNDPRAWKSSEVLMTTRMDIHDNKFCARVYQRRLTDEHLCAGGDTTDGICRGDSGGPLICDVNGEPRLYGVASYTREMCGDPESPGVFTRLGYFYDYYTQLMG